MPSPEIERTEEANQSPRPKSKKSSRRSRKGCPECRQRKIKCDEKRPDCSQCVKAGRRCRMIDSIFRHHSLSFVADSPPRDSPSSDQAGSANQPNSELPRNLTGQEASIGQSISPIPLPVLPHGSTRSSLLSVAETYENDFHRSSSPLISPPSVGSLQRNPGTRGSRSSIIARSNPSPAHSHDPPTELSDKDSPEDCVEISFLLRHFAHEPGRWMDFWADEPSYFSQYIISLAAISPMVRYGACALAAKQLGQMKNPHSETAQSKNSKRIAHTLSDFTWYGAKYYERAILLMSRQISREDCSTCVLSPGGICSYGQATPPPGCNCVSEEINCGSICRVIAACILCQYEDMNANVRFWTGHLNGMTKLIRPLVEVETSTLVRFWEVPEVKRGLSASFWFYVLHDYLNSFVLDKECRLDTNDLSLWIKMGLPLNDDGQFTPRAVSESEMPIIYPRALVYIMCKMRKGDISHSWAQLNTELANWFEYLPRQFAAMRQPQSHPDELDHDSELLIPETWFGSESGAISLGFYHMHKILLRVHQPQEPLSTEKQSSTDLLGTLNVLQKDLHYHAIQILGIFSGMTSSTVRKYMLQPIYVAGRCLTSINERRKAINFLDHIEDAYGPYVKYRKEDLCKEWGVSLSHFESD